MVDRIANPAAAANAYANMAKTAASNTAGGSESAQNNVSFGDVLKSSALNAIETMRAGEAASARAVTGKASMPEVVQAVSAAEITLDMVVGIRDRMISAYQEIMRMPI